MRIFTGFLLPPVVASSVDDFLTPLRSFRGVRWVKPESLHVTLQFLGEVDAQKWPKIRSALTEIQGKTLHLACQGGGVFPPRGNAKIFWTELQGDTKDLMDLAKKMERILEPLGFKPEDR